MKVMKPMLHLLTGLLILASCADARKPEQMEAVAQITAQVDSILQVVEQHPLDSANVLAQKAEMVERRIKNHYFTDTVNMPFARKMDRFKIMRRQLPSLGYDFINIKNGCLEMKEALKHLQSDIENGYNDREKYDEFIQFEKNKSEQLRLLCTDYVSLRDSSLKTYDQLFPELEAFSFKLVELSKSRQ